MKPFIYMIFVMLFTIFAAIFIDTGWFFLFFGLAILSFIITGHYAESDIRKRRAEVDKIIEDMFSDLNKKRS